MELRWMGRYRKLVGQLFRYANIYVRFYNMELKGVDGVSLSAQSWQVLECIIEHEDDSLKMAELSRYLGMPQSTFSKYVKILVSQKLVERFRKEDNQKDIILRPSALGKSFYLERSKQLYENGFKDMFSSLEELSNEDLERVIRSIENLADHFDSDANDFSKKKLIQLK